MKKSLGQIANAAYYACYTDDRFKQKCLSNPDFVRKIWERAAQAVAKEVRRRNRAKIKKMMAGPYHTLSEWKKMKTKRRRK